VASAVAFEDSDAYGVAHAATCVCFKSLFSDSVCHHDDECESGERNQRVLIGKK
jgi:hypothetical protein